VAGGQEAYAIGNSERSCLIAQRRIFRPGPEQQQRRLTAAARDSSHQLSQPFGDDGQYAVIPGSGKLFQIPATTEKVWKACQEMAG